MMTRVWQGTGYNRNARVEEHQYKDGSFHYSLRDRSGAPCDLDDYDDAMEVVRQWSMIDATEEYREAGWVI